jgi:hypothetical protein
MAHMNQEKKRVIKQNLDKLLKPKGIKYGLRVRNHMTIECTLYTGPVDLIGNFKATTGDRIDTRQADELKSIHVNPYWYHDHFTGEAKYLIGDVLDALRSADWYDRSDAQTDYFDTAYYVDLQIGEYNKPYTLTN